MVSITASNAQPLMIKAELLILNMRLMQIEIVNPKIKDNSVRINIFLFF